MPALIQVEYIYVTATKVLQRPNICYILNSMGFQGIQHPIKTWQSGSGHGGHGHGGHMDMVDTDMVDMVHMPRALGLVTSSFLLFPCTFYYYNAEQSFFSYDSNDEFAQFTWSSLEMSRTKSGLNIIA